VVCSGRSRFARTPWTLNSMTRWTSIIIAHQHPERTSSAATMQVRNEDIDDYHDFVNAFRRGPRVPAIASFRVVWGGSAKPYTASDASFVFKGLQTEATIKWSARWAGFEFDSDPPQTSKAVFAAFGKERNGVFRNKT
jgi:hypothetical protein